MSTTKTTKKKQTPLLFDQFSQVYLSTIPPQVHQEAFLDKVQPFINDRYTFFQKAFDRNGHFEVRTKESEKVWYQRSHVFELILPDAPFLVETFKTLFRKYGLKLTRILHPIIAVETNPQGLITQFGKPTETSVNYSLTYIEFEDMENNKTIDALINDIQYHIECIQRSQQDNHHIYQQLDTVNKQLTTMKGKTTEPIPEWKALLKWLDKENFSFFGYTNFTHKSNKVTQSLPAGRGLLSRSLTHKRFIRLNKTIEKLVNDTKDVGTSFAFDTIKSNSPIQRFEKMMRLSIKINTKNNDTIEHIFIGLLRRSSLMTKNMDTPLIHLKMDYIFKARQMAKFSHNYNEVIRIFTTIPKFELFRTPSESLLRMVDDIFSIVNPTEIHCFIQPRRTAKTLPLLVVLPPTLFSRENIDAILAFIKTAIPHKEMECIEVRGNDLCRLHLYLEQEKPESPDVRSLAPTIQTLVMPWTVSLKDLISTEYPGLLGNRLHKEYAPFFPRHYRVRRTPKEALNDILYLEKLRHEKSVQFSLVPFVFDSSVYSEKVSLLTIYSIEKIELIKVMPILQYLGLFVYDELTTRVGSTEVLIGYIHRFRVTDKQGNRIDNGDFPQLIQDLLKQVFEGRTENDPTNELVINAQLNWRTINLVQTYRNLMLQLTRSYTRDKINQTLLDYPHITKQLVDYFYAKFNPNNTLGSTEKRKKTHLPPIRQSFLDSLRAIDTVAEDAIFRRLYNLVRATVRTNFFIQHETDKTAISIKLFSKRVPDIPQPAPKYEIYVHDVGMEGTHLRFGDVARGGLRWSDRPDDFRREILGLVKTQQAKNVVIVPVGAKGGFVIKAKTASKEAFLKEGIKQYKHFIAAMLDMTDTLNEKGGVVHPKDMVFFDHPDPYMVVAADKGTAQLSDVANAISNDYDFWLGDAFASGGSDGYNHKKEAITASGAWECVKLHFKERGKDIDKETFTVAGIGDMSGDVFGNGMLLSNTIRLQAAFNHLHIFLDPNPDAKRSWTERKRLFDRPGSSWLDYNTKLISKGGGIFERKAKEVQLSPEMIAVLGTKKTTLTGEELIQCILKMEVDLLWFGGIGTYIKAKEETDTAVGDAGNDTVRIQTSDCHAQVIGEGANLGLTQRARIELNKSGTGINTDAIDNSAGVNMSDYEVNLKILLKSFQDQQILKSRKARNALLVAITKDVSELCLTNNRAQHRLISLDHKRSATEMDIFIQAIQHLVQAEKLDARELRLLPIIELEKLRQQKKPIPRPVLAVLQAYTKMAVRKQIQESELPQGPLLEGLFKAYFPKKIQQIMAKNKYHDHYLKEAIIHTSLVNKVINQAGITFFFWTEKITGKPVSEIIRAYLLMDDALQGNQFKKQVFDSPIPEDQKYDFCLQYETVLNHLVTDFLLLPQYIDAPYDSFKKKWPKLKAFIETAHPSPSAKESVEKRLSRLVNAFKSYSKVVDIMYISDKHKLDIALAFQLLEKLETLFSFDWIKAHISGMQLSTKWELEHRSLLFQTLRFNKLKFFDMLLRWVPKTKLKSLSNDDIRAKFVEECGQILETYLGTIKQLQSSGSSNLLNINVSIERLNFLK